MDRQVALLFPGQGSQWVGMGRDLWQNFEPSRRAFEEASDALHQDVARLCFEGPEESLRLTANTQPTILTVSVAAFRALHAETGLRPQCAAGHSVGEYAALVAAGAMAFSDAVVLVRKRGQYMQEAVPEGQGSMAAVMGMEGSDVEALCREHAEGQVVVPANFNGPGQVVISGHAEAVERVSREAKARGAKKVIPLAVSAPFHSPLLAPAGERLRVDLEAIAVRPLAFDVISNLEAAAYPAPQAIPDILARQVSHPVRWEACMRAMAQRGVGLALELGPRKVLVGLMKRIAPDVEALQVEDRGGIEAARKALG
jgi:[acyl-carrier-protein] S-malonyltransferase